LLEEFSDNKDIYLEARRLRDKIESLDEKKDKCFIATAVYGTPDAAEVLILRQFRDEVLANSLFGRAFISLYYRVSPPIAGVLHHTQAGRRLVRRVVIAPLVHAVETRGEKN
jgi:hypothetical protein